MNRDTPDQAESNPSHSVTILIEQLKSANRRDYEEAAARIWSRYFDGLLKMASNHLADRMRARVAPEDIIQDMYTSFCARQRRGDFVLGGRDDLWRILVTITQNKAASAAAYHQRQRRDVRKDAQPAATQGGEADHSAILQQAAPEPTPAEAAALNEELQKRLGVLDEPLRQLALWKLEGFTNEEIASESKLGCAVRSVERKLAIIRQKWLEAEQTLGE